MTQKINLTDQNAEKIDLSDDVRKVKEALAKTVHDLRGKAEETLNHSLQDMKVKSADLQENMVKYVKENPIKAILFSVAAGVILGKLLSK